MQEIDAVYWSVSYGIASLAFLLLAILSATGPRAQSGGHFLVVAATASAIWAAVLAWNAQHNQLSALQLLLLELANDAGWIAFLSALLAGAVGAGRRYFFIRYGGLVLVLTLGMTGVVFEVGASDTATEAASGGVLIVGSVLTSLFALVALEQIYRNAREGQLYALKYLVLGLGAIFLYDLVLYTDAILGGQMSQGLWVARGLAVAICVPVIALAVKRSAPSPVGLFVSRQVVFYTATIFATGAYLTVVGLLGSYLRDTSAQLSVPALAVVFFAAVLVMFMLLLSASIRRRIRVLIAKHFFENKYDYRQEWLRLIQTLTGDDTRLPLKKRGIKALAQILECDAGALWLEEGSGNYEYAAGWNCNIDSAGDTAEASLVNFLNRTGWVVDLDQLARDPGNYDDLEFESINLADNFRYIVPLFHNQRLLGMTALTSNNNPEDLNFEDYDLLKMAGRQIAGVLAQEFATKQLAENRQFEAFNKLTAYLMHDLKNVIAQQVLVVDNAEKHKANPEFVNDAIDTIRGGVRRMRRIIDHLQQRSIGQPKQRVELGNVLMRAASDCESRLPLPTLQLCDRRIWVRADPDKLQMAIFHALRNAQDATHPEGKIDVTLTADNGQCRIEIEDSGTGMTQEFIRDRVFKPFDSTKGSEGMGMGAYQLRETVTELGGSVEIASTPGTGTTVTITLFPATQE